MDNNVSQNDSLPPRSKSYGKWIIYALILIFLVTLFFIIFWSPGEGGIVTDDTGKPLSNVLVTREIVSQSPYLGIPNPGGGGGYYKRTYERTLTDSSGKFNFDSYIKWGRIFTISYIDRIKVRKIGYYLSGFNPEWGDTEGMVVQRGDYNPTLLKLNLDVLQKEKINILSLLFAPHDSESLPSDYVIKFNIDQTNYILSNFPEVDNIPLDGKYYYSDFNYTEYFGDYLRRILMSQYEHARRFGFDNLDVSLAEKERLCDLQINLLYFNDCQRYLFNQRMDDSACYKIKQIDKRSMEDRYNCDSYTKRFEEHPMSENYILA